MYNVWLLTIRQRPPGLTLLLSISFVRLSVVYWPSPGTQRRLISFMQRIFICIQRFIAIELPETFIVMQRTVCCIHVQMCKLCMCLFLCLYYSMYVSLKLALLLFFIFFSTRLCLSLAVPHPPPFCTCVSLFRSVCLSFFLSTSLLKFEWFEYS